MSVHVRPPEGEGAKRVSRTVDRIVTGIARHWLALINLIVAVFVALPFLAPVLMNSGATGPANLIYRLYAPACHQLPERSIFLFGSERFYSVRELEADEHLPTGLNILQRQALRWAGSVETGWKVALCQRDVAIYGSLLLGGLVFGLLRPTLRRRLGPSGKWPKLPVWTLLVFLLPIAVDGLTQLFGLRESRPELRFFTGALMGMGLAFFAAPYVEEAMADVLRNTNTP